MDYGKLLTDAWDTIWKNKFLIILGVLVALGNAGGSGGSQGVGSGEADTYLHIPPRIDFQAPLQDLGLPALGAGLVVALAAVALLVTAVLWIAGTIARGGLISGANEVSCGRRSSFNEAFQAGWQKGWRLIGIGLIPMAPVLVLLVISVAGFGLYQSVEFTRPADALRIPNAAIAAPAAVLALLLLLAALVLTLMRTFANRACMLEDTGVLASYRRGVQVLVGNLGPAVVLFILQVVISIAFLMLLLLPGLVVSLCCLLWPVLLLGQGLFAAYYSTLWTLAWNQWVGGAQELEDAGAVR